MDKIEFTIFYDGPALQDGIMDAQELAPALLGLANLISLSNHALNGEKAKVVVSVKAGAQPGSFPIDLQIVQAWTEQLLKMFSKEEASGAVNLIQMLFWSGCGCVSLFKLIKFAGKKIHSRVQKREDGMYRLFFDDKGGEKSIDVTESVLKLYRSFKIREAAESFVKPLKSKGIDEIGTIYNKDRKRIITKEEVECFDTPEVEGEKIADSERIMFFSIESLSFKPDNKWRLFDGTNGFWVTIKDMEFLSRVNGNQESFHKGDTLKISLREIQYQTPQGLKTEYEALRILDHSTPEAQIPLNLEGEDPNQNNK